MSPDILPPGSVRIGEVWIDDKPYTNFDADALTVTLPETDERVRGQGHASSRRHEVG